MVSSVDQVLEALHALYFTGPSSGQNADAMKVKQKEADQWLEGFQKTKDAWGIADVLIRNESLGLEVRIFAAQTFRQKIIYDLHQLEPSDQTALRDSILGLLHQYRAGPKGLTRQLTLSLVGLTIQLKDWMNPVPQMMEVFGKEDSIPILLDYLAQLAEEVDSGERFSMNREDFMARADHLLAENASAVLARMLTYLETHSHSDMACRIFTCVYAWVKTGDIKVTHIMSSPLFNYMFEALRSDSLFDIVSDLICEVVAWSKKLRRTNPDVVPAIMTRILPLAQLIPASKDEPDKMRGLCRIFTEVGECYEDLILENFTAFKGVVDSLLMCCSFDDLDIVQMTFNFWHDVADDLMTPEHQHKRAEWIDTFRQLVDMMIKHLHYPADLKEWTAKERDEFRDFRHVMGDVLKDCVKVIGQEEALARPMLILSHLTVSGSNTFQVETKWQDIEAPLFAVRAMGGQVSKDEAKVMAQIMSLLPQLPNHPKVKYAAILVIGRYAHWTAQHPEFISYQMNFVSKGFEDSECVAASALALKYLCEFCGRLLVDYLTQLYPFYTNLMTVLKRHERREMTEGIAHVISAVPADQVLKTLQTFCLPTAQRLHEIAQKGKPGKEQEEIDLVKEAQELLDQISVFLKIVNPPASDFRIPDNQPHPMVLFLKDLWPVFEGLWTHYGDSPVADSISRILKYSVDNLKQHLVPLLPQMVSKSVEMYDSTGQCSYMWIARKCIETYCKDSSVGMEMAPTIEKITQISLRLFQSTRRLDDIPDGKFQLDKLMLVVEDYFSLLCAYLKECPALFIQLPSLAMIIQTTLGCLVIENPEGLTKVLYFLSDFLETLAPTFGRITMTPTPFISPDQLREVRVKIMTEYGQRILHAILDGTLHRFPRDRDVVREVGSAVWLCLDALKEVGGLEVLHRIVFEIPEAMCPSAEKQVFLTKAAAALQDSTPLKMKNAVNDFSNAFRRRNLQQSRKRE